MDELTDQQQAVELLQQLGLKEYEARAFVALSRLPRGTAKDISEISEVPRTRVYDAIRVLETKGLVEVQHSNPQQFRSVSFAEATETLRDEYESRTELLHETLQDLEPANFDSDAGTAHEVWALSGNVPITNRAHQLLDEAENELVFVIGHDSVVTDTLFDSLKAAQQRGVTIIVGTISGTLRERVQDRLPNAEVFVSGLEWLSGAALTDDETEISRILLVDRSTILVSSFHEAETGERSHEQAVFGRGFDNGLVAIVRRLMATGLVPLDDPGTAGSDRS
ncbi:TrmB family transcriptional regulator [Natrarchaeobius halalkaliphilus]|uniref:TrmB family transcriptional regulator n=1 Tax=Natrarchaeobius halalkaliphilus TaxID=1679091 RepID=A0A3N6LV73_9EURY|nr:helix-turn-helix domain-containing protein [Natrarchaeobius halalkaliphilus]RQG91564.1 TrmB family transcriptional regulator [Natrarchaeobius halalkaliphilus]